MKLLSVGCGNMGKALLNAWIEKGLFNEAWVVQPSLSAQPLFSTIRHVHFVTSIAGVPRTFRPDVVLFANKPQKAIEVVPHYTQFAPDALYVSIMAGVSIAWLSKILGSKAAIARLIPNLAAKISQSMSVAVSNDHLNLAQREIIVHLGEAIGKLLWVTSENLLEAATPISGSGPAYFFLLTECFSKAAQELGFSESEAQVLAEQTILGSALLLEEGTQSAQQLREAVCSKGGVTLAALEVFNEADSLAKRVTRAVEAGLKRAKELAL